MDVSNLPRIAVFAASSPPASSSSSSRVSVLDEATTGTGTGTSLEHADSEILAATIVDQLVKVDGVPIINIVPEHSELVDEHREGQVVIIPSCSSSINSNDTCDAAPLSTSTPDRPVVSTVSTAATRIGTHHVRRSSPLQQEIYDQDDDECLSQPSFVVEQDLSVHVEPKVHVLPMNWSTSTSAVTPVRVATLREKIVSNPPSPSKDWVGESLESPYSEKKDNNEDLSLLMNERGSFLLPSDESLAPTPIRKKNQGNLSEIVEDQEEEEEEEDVSVEMDNLLRGLREGSSLITLGGSTRTVRDEQEEGRLESEMGLGEEGEEKEAPSRIALSPFLASTPSGVTHSTHSPTTTSPTPSTQANGSLTERSNVDVEELFKNIAGTGIGMEGAEEGMDKGVEDESMLSLFGKRDGSVRFVNEKEERRSDVEAVKELNRSVGMETPSIPTSIPKALIKEPSCDHSTTTLDDVQGAFSRLLLPSVSDTIEREKRVEDESMLSFELMRDESMGTIGPLTESPSAIEEPASPVVGGLSPLGTPEGMRTVRPSSPVVDHATTTMAMYSASKVTVQGPVSVVTATAVPTPSRGLERLRNKMQALRMGALQTNTIITHNLSAPDLVVNPTPSIATEESSTTPSTPIRRPRLSSSVLQTPIGSSAAALRLEKYRAMTPKTVVRPDVSGAEEKASREGVVPSKPVAEGEGERMREDVGATGPRITPTNTTTRTPMRTNTSLNASTGKRHKRSELIQLTSSAGKSLFSPALAAGRRSAAMGVVGSPSVRLGRDKRRSLIATATISASPVKMRAVREGEVEVPMRRSTEVLVGTTMTTATVRSLTNPTTSATMAMSRAARVGSSTTTTRSVPSIQSRATATTPSRISLLTGGRPTPRTTATTRVVPNRNDQNIAPSNSIRNTTRPSTTSTTTTTTNLLPLRSSAVLKTRPTFQPRVLKPLVSSRTLSTMDSAAGGGVGARFAMGVGVGDRDRPRFGLGPLPARTTTGTISDGVGGGVRKPLNESSTTTTTAGVGRSLALGGGGRGAESASRAL
ncbi:BQ2448_3872 [Microbotryum intermedium]|uniref:BQ2448_3872 protein n=1 Tax=Microbotryum intermedium TaxID=269621 RepID=A0A238FGL9_9BASI|nr:BQ2448_3872 [Microbotryum intermedium]